MRLNLIKYLLAAVALTGMTTSCQNHFDDPELTVPEATMRANTTIRELKEAFMSTNATLCPVKDEATQEHYIIHGRVISSDATGNIYQALMVQDETGAMPITIRRASLYNEYHLGQEVVIDVTGLWIGRYNNLMQLGWLGEPYNGVDQLTFMSFYEFASHTEINGNPTVNTRNVPFGSDYPDDRMYCISMDIDELADIPALSEECVMLQGQLVEFANVRFVDGGVETYAPYQETVNRYIYGSGSSKQVVVRNSGYSTFYNDMLPSGTGRVRGILSWYGDGAANSSAPNVIQGWQLLLRSVDDVIFDDRGTREKPYGIDEVLAMESNGITGWAQGYIVGSVNIADNSYVFGNGADSAPNNLLLAASPDETDPNLCVVLALPAGTKLRELGALDENPGNYRKHIAVYGRFSDYQINGSTYPGIIDNPGTGSYFDIEGVVIPGVTGEGTGSQDDPFTVTFALANWQEGTSGWFVGEITGYVEGSDFATGVRFGIPDEDANYANANIVISVPGQTPTVDNSITVRLTADARKTLGLKNAPEVYGKRILINGSLEEYLKQPGIRMTDYQLSGASE